VSPGLNPLPSWNTVRLEPCRAFRREATFAPARHALVSTRSRGRCHVRPPRHSGLRARCSRSSMFQEAVQGRRLLLLTPRIRAAGKQIRQKKCQVR
jgi:hypothetical protein